MVAAGHPAQAQPGQAEGLGHHPQGDPVFIDLAGRGQPVLLIVFQEAIDLVGEQQEPPPAREFGKAREALRLRQVAAGIVGKIDHHGPRGRRDLVLQPIGIQRPPLAGPAFPAGHPAAHGLGHRGQRLVARRLDDQVVARLQGGVHEDKDRLLGAGENQDVIGADAIVQAGDLAAQGRVAARLGVAQAQGPESFLGPGLHGQQFAQGKGFAVRGAKVGARAELMAGEKTLQGERDDPHGCNSGKREAMMPRTHSAGSCLAAAGSSARKTGGWICRRTAAGPMRPRLPSSRR